MFSELILVSLLRAYLNMPLAARGSNRSSVASVTLLSGIRRRVPAIGKKPTAPSAHINVQSRNVNLGDFTSLYLTGLKYIDRIRSCHSIKRRSAFTAHLRKQHGLTLSHEEVEALASSTLDSSHHSERSASAESTPMDFGMFNNSQSTPPVPTLYCQLAPTGFFAPLY